MKLIDKFLSKLKTDRNTFFTYVLTLITAYIVVDRVVELLFLFFTGMSVSYWGPIKYTLAMACPIFAFLFSYSSKFIKSDEVKVSFFYVYCICLYIIGISMLTQWLNHLYWLLLLSVPNYKEIILEFSDLIRPAFTALALYLPLTTFYKLVLWLYKVINDPIFPNNFKESICDYQGIDISASDNTTGPYSFEIAFCKDKSTGKPAKILENRRFDTTLVIGPSGTGKSAMVMEPMIAKDLEKKFFFRETAKEMGYTALKTRIATLNCPYDNEYINKNFTLNMLTPVEDKEKVYKAYMNKLIYAITPDNKIVYKDLGLTSVSPDAEQTYRIADVCKNLNIPVNVIDPLDPNSPGLNPFIIENPALCGLIVSMVLRTFFSPSNSTAELAYMEDVALQAIQNLVILLKTVYTRQQNEMPTLQELLKCLTNFDFVESMCMEWEKDEVWSKDYELQIGYFKQHFYKDSSGRKDMQRYLHFVTAQLDVLLRTASIRTIVCNRHNNISFADILENNKVTLLCSRPTDIGGVAHGGFGKFFLCLMMCSVESRPGTEKTRTPHFLYVDDFDKYSPAIFEDAYTIYRKFKVGAVFSAQTLSSLGGVNASHMQKLLSNASTKISFGNNTPEDYTWWEQEFGKRREWVIGNNYNKEDGEYSSNLGNVVWDWKDTMKKAKIQGLKFKGIIYKTKDKKGKNIVNFGSVDFLESKYKEPRKIKTYNFNKYLNLNNSTNYKKDENQKEKFNPKNIDFNTGSFDPIQTNTTDASYLFDNEDAISFNLNNTNNNE